MVVTPEGSRTSTTTSTLPPSSAEYAAEVRVAARRSLSARWIVIGEMPLASVNPLGGWTVATTGCVPVMTFSSLEVMVSVPSVSPEPTLTQGEPAAVQLGVSRSLRTVPARVTGDRDADRRVGPRARA